MVAAVGQVDAKRPERACLVHLLELVDRHAGILVV
jgi:hypothetical protein